MYGQMIPLHGFENSNDNINKAFTYKSMKTTDLQEIREKELRLLDDSD